jgi:hypothetical protein
MCRYNAARFILPLDESVDSPHNEDKRYCSVSTDPFHSSCDCNCVTISESLPISFTVVVTATVSPSVNVFAAGLVFTNLITELWYSLCIGDCCDCGLCFALRQQFGRPVGAWNLSANSIVAYLSRRS